MSKRKKVTRRTAVKSGLAAAVSIVIADRAIAVESGGELRVKLVEADGLPLASERLRHFHVRDMEGDPLPLEIRRAPGQVMVTLPAQPVQLVVRLKIPDFGEVNCYADNGGKGYTQGGEVDFVTEAATTRFQRVRAAMESAKSELAQPTPLLPDPRESPYEKLSKSMHAGESFALNLARHRISRFPQPRRDVLFSGLSSPLTYYPNLIAPFKAIFNYGPTSWYTWNKEDGPFDQTIDYLRMDQTVNILLANNIAPKIFGYCYMMRGATPKWMQPDDTSSSTNEIDSGDDSHNRFNARWPYDRIKAEYQRVLRQTAQRYSDRAHYVEVINEAHDKTNMWGLNHEQILEMTRLACQAVRQGSPTMARVINNCCLWAEYAVHSNRDGSRRWSPYRYLQDCLKAGAEFEIVGLQLYYPQYDLFEIDRMLDRFTKLGKPIQITEMSTASQDGVDTASMRPAAAPGWHGPWSEATQADWAEGMYTLCYSKPQIKAIGWWDFADLPNHFWTFGGLLRADGTPKPAYHRIIQLQKQWGVGPDAGR